MTATASDGNASVEVMPEDADDGDQVALVVGKTTISVEVADAGDAAYEVKLNGRLFRGPGWRRRWGTR